MHLSEKQLKTQQRADKTLSFGCIVTGRKTKTICTYLGKTFVGWKGGDFTMNEDTRLWVSNPGNASKTGIYDITQTEYEVILHTTIFDF